ncbi:MAG: HNH endonuclease [candidate division Zixibacteria bacterium]|nr:HNH endonuclease [candidate division Zixibacteria bacterium]
MVLQWGDDRDSKRSLTLAQRKKLYEMAKGRCQNPGCRRKIDFDVMQVGHKTAHSKGGKTNLRNCVCLCGDCNKRQGTSNWGRFLKKQGVEDPKTKLKRELQKLSLHQLKNLAEKHKVTLRGKTVETLTGSAKRAPTKIQYVNKLSVIVKEKELTSIPKLSKTVKKKRRVESSFW